MAKQNFLIDFLYFFIFFLTVKYNLISPKNIVTLTIRNSLRQCSHFSEIFKPRAYIYIYIWDISGEVSSSKF